MKSFPTGAMWWITFVVMSTLMALSAHLVQAKLKRRKVGPTSNLQSVEVTQEDEEGLPVEQDPNNLED